MLSATGEHNRLEREIADQAAERLQALFYSPPDDLPVLPTDNSIGSPHLVDSLDEAPSHAIMSDTAPANVYAVDGGSSVFARGGNIEVIAWRAGMVRFRDRLRLSESCPPPEILAYNRLEVTDILREYTIDLPVEYVADKSPIRPVDELRWLAEWRLINSIIDEADAGTLLLIDGSLRGHNALDPGFQKNILRKANERQVYVAAITKQSSLSLNGTQPLDVGDSLNSMPEYDVWYRKLNRSLGKGSGWLGNIYLAGLHPKADKPYRVDINRFDESNVDKIFSMIISVSDDIEFCGYPYPLVAAHRLARIDNLFRQEIIGSIGQALERRQFSPRTWEYLVGDIHDKLNADVLAQAQDHLYG